MRGDQSSRVSVGVPQCWGPIFLGERAGAEKICKLRELFDGVVCLGGKHLHERECRIGDRECGGGLLAAGTSGLVRIGPVLLAYARLLTGLA